MKKLLLAPLAMLTAAGLTAAEFTPNGSIEGKSGKIGFNERGDFEFSDNGGKIPSRLSAITPDGAWFSQTSLEGLKKEVDVKGKRVVLRGTIPPTSKSPAIPLECSLSLLPDGRTARIAFEPGSEPKGFNLYFAFNFGGRDFASGREVFVDGEKIDCSFDRNRRERIGFFNGKAKECVLRMPADNSELKLSIVSARSLELVEDWNKNAKAFISFDMVCGFPQDGKLALDIDLDSVPPPNAASYIVGAMDFGPNKFKLPDYSVCKNLVQNPSFEDGLYFWADRPHGNAKNGEPPDEALIAIDETTAAVGKRSLRQVLSPALISNPCTFAIPVKPKTKYAISLYAKTDAETPFALSLTGWTQAGGPYIQDKTFGMIGKEWKRYSVSLTAPNKLLQIALASKYSGEKPVRIWFDAVQLEEGDVATEFACPAVEAVFETAIATNLFQPGEKISPRFRLCSEKPQAGSVSYVVKDLFKRNVGSGSVEFKTSGGFEPSVVAVPEPEGLGPGTYAVDATVVAQDFRNELFYRFNLMPFMNGPLKNKELFCGHLGAGMTDTLPVVLDEMAKAGVGSMVMFAPPKPPVAKLLKRLGLAYCACVFGPDEVLKDNAVENYMGKYCLNLPSPNNISTVKDEDLPAFEERAFSVASRHPDVKLWKLVNEPVHNRDEEIARSIDVLAYTCKGIRRAIPDAKIFTPDPPGIGPEYLHKFWNRGGSKICDYVATHPYRDLPERPDLDKDIAELLRGLPKDVPVYFTEGNYFCHYELPENNLHAFGPGDKTLCMDHYRGGAFTWDIGIGEMASLAHTMRYRLQTMKYADRVKWDCDWALSPSSIAPGLDAVLDGRIFAVNTLASLLGDAEFKSDVVFGEPVRCYLFEDGRKRPVAVLWNFDADAFSRPEVVSKLDLSGLNGPFEILSMTGAKEKAPADKLLPITACPVFLRGAPGGTSEFKKRLEGLDMIGGNAPDFKIETAIVDGKLAMTLKNARARERAGSLKMKADGQELISREVALPPAGEFRFEAPIPQAKTLQTARYEIDFAQSGKPAISKKLPLEHFDVEPAPAGFKADGDLSKWASVEPVELKTLKTYPPDARSKEQAKYLAEPVPYKGAKDLSAFVKMAFSKDALFMLVKVTDDVYHPAQGPLAGSYNGDSLQIYFDSFADAKNSDEDGFGQDDQAYDVRSLDGKTVEVNRSVAPYAQLAFTRKGAEPRVKGVFVKTDDGYFFDLEFPLETILPIELKPGKGVGVSILVNDNDGDYRKRALYLNKGTEPFQHPALYPTMLFK